MWYFENAVKESDLGRRLVSALEHVSAVPTFPDWKTIWTFEDKISQHYLLEAARIPTPWTWVFWHREAAMEFADAATYPVVLKPAFGITAKNVCLIQTPAEARYWIGRLFGSGVASLYRTRTISMLARTLERLDDALECLRGYPPLLHRDGPIQRGSVLFQQFIPDNNFDTRVTVIGNRAFAFRRINRSNDFRASGSGRIDWNPDRINRSAVHLAFDVAANLDTQVVAVDILDNGGGLVVNEISYYYEAWAIEECPGHWKQASEDEELEWVESSMHPGEAVFSDFIALLNYRFEAKESRADR